MMQSDGSSANNEVADQMQQPPEPAIIETSMVIESRASSDHKRVGPTQSETLDTESPSATDHRQRVHQKNKQKLKSAAQQSSSASKKAKIKQHEGGVNSQQSGKNNNPDKTTAYSSKNDPTNTNMTNDNSSKRQQKQPRFSIFDQLEEFQFQSYEMGSKLKSLVDIILLQHNQQEEDGFLTGNIMKAIPPEDWNQIRQLSYESNSVFESMQTALGNFFERMQEEITKWKRRCGRLQYKLTHYQNYPASGGSHTRKSGTNKSEVEKAGGYSKKETNRPQKLLLSGSHGRKMPDKQGTDDEGEPAGEHPGSPYDVTGGTKGSQGHDRRRLNRHKNRKGDQNGTGNLLTHGAKHSLSSSCHPPSAVHRAGGNATYLKLTQQQNQLLQQSWLDIATVYDKNRTQMNSFMDEMELAVHELKQAREKLNVKHLGTMTTVEQEMEALLQDITTARSQRSHHSQATNGGGMVKSHRSSHRQSRSHLLLNANSAKASQRQQNSSVITPQKSKQIASTKPLQMLAQQQSANLLHNNSLATSGNITVMSESKKHRGKSQSVMPSGHSSGVRSNDADDLLVESPHVKPEKSAGKGLVPPLPIHMINNSSGHHGSQPSQPQQQAATSQRQHSHRTKASASKPPQPESFRRQQSQRSNNSRHSRHSRHSARHSGRNALEKPSLSRAHSQRSSQKLKEQEQVEKERHNAVNSNNVSGAIVEGALVNPIMVSAAAGNLSSRFDNQLESDFDRECDATLQFETERLRQFPEEYAIVASIKDDDHRILQKQIYFMKYEKQIKIQLKQEKIQRQQNRKLAQQMRSRQEYQSGTAGTYQNPPGHNRSRLGSNASSSYQTPAQQHRPYNSSNGESGKAQQQEAASQQNKNDNARDIKLSQILDVSGIQLESSLSQIGTQEVRNNLRCGDEMQDAKLSQLLAVDHEISGLLTVTQKELIEMVDKDLQLQAELREGDRKVLEWSSCVEDESKPAHSKRKDQQARNQSLLHKPSSEAQLQVDTSDLLVARDPSSASEALSAPEHDKNSHRQYRSNNYQSGPEQSSFQNDSSFFEDQPTPPVMISRQQQQFQSNPPDHQNSNIADVGAEAPMIIRPRPHTEMSGAVLPLSSQPDQRDQIEIIEDIMATGEDSFDQDDDDSYYARQKKSLEIITERQSEFSNTNGTSARPGSHRSKMSSKFIHGGNTNNSSMQNKSAIAATQNAAGAPISSSNSGKKTAGKNGKPPQVGNYVTNQVQASAEYILLNAAQAQPAANVAKQRYSYQTAYGRSDVNSISGEQEPSEMGINAGGSMASSAKRSRRQDHRIEDDQQSYVDTSFIEEGQTDDQNSSKIGRIRGGSNFTPLNLSKVPFNHLAADQGDDEVSPHRRIFRSNSEVYLKRLDDMQDTEDAFLMPIAYAADVTEGHSDYVTVDPAPIQTQMVMIDSSQMNNLMNANAVDYSQSSFNNIVNSSVCLRLQRIFMQAQLSASRGQAKTQFALKASVGTVSNMNPLSKTPSQHVPPESKAAPLVGSMHFTRSNSLSIQQNAPQHVYRKTIQMMLSSGYYSHSALRSTIAMQAQVGAPNNQSQSQSTQPHIQAIANSGHVPWLYHNHNPAAGLLFSSSLAPVSGPVAAVPGQHPGESRTVSGSANVAIHNPSSRTQTASGRGVATTNTTSSLIPRLEADLRLAAQTPGLITDSDQRRKSADEPQHYRTHQNGAPMSSLEEKRSVTSLGHAISHQDNRQQQLIKMKTNNYHTLATGHKQVVINNNQQKQQDGQVNRIKAPKMLNIARKESSSGRGGSANQREAVSPLNYQNVNQQQSSNPQQKVPGLLNQSTGTSRSTGVIKRTAIRKIPVRRILDSQNIQAARNSTNVQNISIQSLSNIGGSLSHQSISTQKQQQQQQQQPSTQPAAHAPNYKQQQQQNAKVQNELIQQFLSHQKQQIINQGKQSNQSSVVTTPSAARTDSNKGGVATLLQKKSLKHRNAGVQQQQSHSRDKSYDNQKRGNQITPRKQAIGAVVNSFDRNSTPYQHSEQQEYASAMAQMLYKPARKQQ